MIIGVDCWKLNCERSFVMRVTPRVDCFHFHLKVWLTMSLRCFRPTRHPPIILLTMKGFVSMGGWGIRFIHHSVCTEAVYAYAEIRTLFNIVHPETHTCSPTLMLDVASARFVNPSCNMCTVME
jgi:hypothetical protein